MFKPSGVKYHYATGYERGINNAYAHHFIENLFIYLF